MKNYYISIETTGLHPLRDDICEIAILNDASEIVYHSVVQPIRDSGTYPESEITAAMRENAPKWSDIEPEVRQILQGNRVFAWDLLFTTSFLTDVVTKETKTVDVQSWFTERGSDYPASLRGMATKHQLMKADTWDGMVYAEGDKWVQRCIPKAQFIIGLVNCRVNAFIDGETAWVQNNLKWRGEAYFKQWKHRIAAEANVPTCERRVSVWRQGFGCESPESVFNSIIETALPYSRPKKGFIEVFRKVRNLKRIPIAVQYSELNGCSFYRRWENWYGGGTSEAYFVGLFQPVKTGAFSVTEMEYKELKRLVKQNKVK